MLEFENLLFTVEHLHKYQSPEQRPFEHKYRARKLLQEYRPTLSDAALLGIVDYYLGVNYIDTEENSIANQHFGRAFTNFMKVVNIQDYYGYILAIYNHMGYLALNQDQNDVGMAILAKAELLGPLIQPNLSGYKHQGGFPMLEQTYTLTLFYLAQAYTKLGSKDKVAMHITTQAAQYCGQTMLRQFRARTYELKDFCVNCISLSEYYSSIGHISQAIYLLQVADSLFVAGKKRKLRATLQMSTGRAMHEFMSYCVGKIKAGEQDDAKVLGWVNQQLVKFDGVECNFVVFQCAKNYEEVKSLFRQSYTLYKKALQYFVLDGYVTEHIQIQQDISQMYKELSLLEKEANNIVGLLEKRRGILIQNVDIITPIINEINPKAFQGTFEKLLIEVSEINNEIYEFIYAFNYIDDFQSKNKKLADKMNQAAQLVINGYRQIVKQLELVESQARDQQYYQSIITSQFNIAKALSKIQPKEKQEKVNYLIESLKTYQLLMAFIKNDAKQFDFSQEFALCKEMAALLPNRIDKLNYSGQ